MSKHIVSIVQQVPHQKLVLMFGLEHGSHLLQVNTVSLLLQLRGEEHGDDPLGDVGQVEVVVALHHSLHHAVHAEAPGGTEKEKMEGERKEEERERAWSRVKRDTERKVDMGQKI